MFFLMMIIEDSLEEHYLYEINLISSRDTQNNKLWTDISRDYWRQIILTTKWYKNYTSFKEEDFGLLENIFHNDCEIINSFLHQENKLTLMIIWIRFIAKI